jgi:hypothetical protein
MYWFGKRSTCSVWASYRMCCWNSFE